MRILSLLGFKSCHRSQDLDSELDIAVLEDRTLYSGSPIPIDIAVHEDAGNSHIDLLDVLSVSESEFGDLQLSIDDNSNPGLFDLLRFHANGELEIDYAANQHGSANIGVTASANDGSSQRIDLNVDVESINDAPTFLGFHDLTVTSDQSQTVINLHTAFDDVEDEDSQLKFHVVQNTDNSLFQSVTIDHDDGLLILQHDPGQLGSSEIQVIATDRGGLTAGWSTDDSFTIYDRISGTTGIPRATIDAAGVQQIQLWTESFFFNFVNGQADYSNLNEAKLSQFLQTADANVPVTLNLEHELFDNSPEGRDRFAEIIHQVNSERPDLDVGVYRIMPEKSWYAPVNVHRANEAIDQGLTGTYYGLKQEEYRANHENWQSRNDLFRTESVRSEFGGQSVADMLDQVNPSLYTPYSEYAETTSDYFELTFDVAADRIYTDPAFVHAHEVYFAAENGGLLDNGIRQLQPYYVVNANHSSFQVSETRGGSAIDLTDNYSGRIYVKATEFDPVARFVLEQNVTDFKAYAEGNIAEARRFGGTVNAWISPTISGAGSEVMSPDFFRLQLDVLRPLADNIVIFEYLGTDVEANQGWWRAVEDFASTLNDPAATFTITVNDAPPENVAPVAQSDSLSVNEDQPLSIFASQLLANDSDDNGNALTIQFLAAPSHGLLTAVGDQVWRYDPNENYHGSDSFGYRVSDGQTTSNLAIVHLNVIAHNDTPIAHSDSLEANEDVPFTFSAASLLNNDVDVDSEILTVQFVGDPSHGTITNDGNGTFTYLSNQDFFGTDSFEYRITDGLKHSQNATVTIQVDARNDAPTAYQDAVVTPEDHAMIIRAADFLENDRDVDSENLNVQIVNQPANGLLIDHGNATWTYRPDANFHGSDRITYRISDGAENSNTSAMNITVTARNDAPEAHHDQFEVRNDQSLSVSVFDLLKNDVDIDGDDLSIRILSQPLQGEVELQKGKVHYTPLFGFTGEDSWSYEISDGTSTSIATVRVNVLHGKVQAVNDEFVVNEDQSLIVLTDDLLANDVNLTGQSRIEIVKAPAHGELVQSEIGRMQYQPDANYYGMDSIKYRIVNGDQVSNVSTVSFRINPVNDAPVGKADAFVTTQGQGLAIAPSDLLKNDVDREANPLTLASYSTPDKGNLEWRGGRLRYTPLEGFLGVDRFTYQISDGQSHSDDISVWIEVRPEVKKAVHVPLSRVEFDDLAPNTFIPQQADTTPNLLANDNEEDQEGAISTTPAVSSQPSGSREGIESDVAAWRIGAEEIARIMTQARVSRDSTWAIHLDPDG